MGLSIREMLSEEYFKGCRVIAGKDGLDRQIQGVALFDAPDGFKWVQGREFILTSGYLFHLNPELFDRFSNSDSFNTISGFGIKERYVKEIPKPVIEAFDRNNVPLIIIPPEPSWMNIISHLNILVMNKSIRRFNIRDISSNGFSDLTYQVRKINRILTQIENEMNFPAMLYDISSEKVYFSSSNFVDLLDDFQLENFWHPHDGFEQEVLCDNLQMIRYRFRSEKYQLPYSWITVPITVNDRVKAYFVIVEETGLIDYFDQFTLRIGFLLIQALYEQILVAQNIGDAGFEKLMQDIISENYRNNTILLKQAEDIGLSITENYYLVVMKQISENSQLIQQKEHLKNSFSSLINTLQGRSSFYDENTCLLLFPQNNLSNCNNLKAIQRIMEDIVAAFLEKNKDMNVIFGLSDIPTPVHELKRSFQRCEQTIKIGRLLFPGQYIMKYTDLGTFAWLNIEEDELDIMLSNIKGLLKDPDSTELIETLITYLECNMNYSLTAKKRFVHINTVRKRISYINDIIQCDLEDPLTKLNLEILLKLFNHKA